MSGIEGKEKNEIDFWHTTAFFQTYAFFNLFLRSCLRCYVFIKYLFMYTLGDKDKLVKSEAKSKEKILFWHTEALKTYVFSVCNIYKCSYIYIFFSFPY